MGQVDAQRVPAPAAAAAWCRSVRIRRSIWRRVRATPERFGLRADDGLDDQLAAIEQVLANQLAAHRIEYTRSDGSVIELSLTEVVDRAERLEMAYNPNDCVEIRWGAAPGSDEMATCARHAPVEQRERMQSYRDWFSTRTRPPR